MGINTMIIKFSKYPREKWAPEWSVFSLSTQKKSYNDDDDKDFKVKIWIQEKKLFS